jgi:carboxyl-terminal processing protease
LIGRTDDGFGYVAVGSLTADENTTKNMLAAFDSLLDAKGLIVDLRVNGGGDERIAQQFVSRLVSEPLVYASHKVRGGAAYENFLPPMNRQVMPRAGQTYRGPVVGLIGRGCVSSGEAFALMLRALPQTKLIGQPTRGASGNPHPIALPNGVTVHYPIWISLQLDGKPLEGVGIAPDVTIDEDPTGIKGLQAAVEELNRRAK